MYVNTYGCAYVYMVHHNELNLIHLPPPPHKDITLPIYAVTLIVLPTTHLKFK